MKQLLLATIFAHFASQVFAQMTIGNDTLFGNEWINFDAQYFKIKVAEDGIYRVPQSAIAAAGLGAVAGSQFQLFHEGREVPIFVSTDAVLGTSDFIEFWGEKNRAALDEHLFFKKDQMLNREYSIYNDTSAYFLTFSTGTVQPLRIKSEANDLTNLPTAEPYFLAKTKLVFTENYSKKRLNEQGHTNSFFDAEGWGSAFLANDSLTEISIPTPNAAANGPNAAIEARYLTDLSSHTIAISVNGNLVQTDPEAGSSVRLFLSSIPANEVGAKVDLRWDGSSKWGRTSVGDAFVTYPHTPDFEGKKVFEFQIDGNTGGKKLLEISNFDAAGGDVVFYDITQKKRILGENTGNLIRISMTTAAGNQTKAVIFNSNSGVKTVAMLAPVFFKNWKNTNASFVIVTNKKLFNDPTDPTGTNWVQAHADYRASIAGGGYTTLVADAEAVCDQFGWGVSGHGQGIRNFFFWMKKNWPAAKHVMMVGKPRELRDSRTSAQIASLGGTFVLPTFGYPSSDNLFVMKNGSLVPHLSIGRIAAKTGTDVKNYLQKLIEYEAPDTDPQTIAGQKWKKNVMHLSGGDPSILNDLRSYMADFENILESSKMGAEVTTFSKTSTDPVQTSPVAGMLGNFKKGVSIFSVFGHSNPFGFDSYVEPPAKWDNKGLYPVMFAFGCYSGQCTTNGTALGENVTLSANSGGIGYYATTGYGYLNDLHQIGRTYFDSLGNKAFGVSIGEVWRKTAAEMARPLSEIGYNQLLAQMFYQGDPAMVLNPMLGPDYVIDPASLKISPEPVAIDRDSFNIKFDLLNLARNQADTVTIQIDLKNNTGLATTPVFLKIIPKKYRTEVSVNFPIPKQKPMEWLGFNRLEMTVDPANLISELPAPDAELNNRLVGPDGQPGVPVYFFGNDVQPIVPADFSILTKNNLKLVATTLNPNEPKQNYFWEIDTTAKFNSPLLSKITTTQLGGILEWTPSISLLDSTVYYWRISRDTAGLGYFVWHDMSFLYKNGSSEGWNQSHTWQFDKDLFADGMYIDSLRKLSFKDFQFEVRIELGLVGMNPFQFGYKQQIEYHDKPIATSSVQVSEFDGVTGQLLEPLVNGVTLRHVPFAAQTQAGRKDLMEFLKNGTQTGNYVLFFANKDVSGNHYRPQDWATDSLVFGENVFQILEKEGAKLLRQQAVDSVANPYFFLYKKGGGYVPSEGFWGGPTPSSPFLIPLWYKLDNGQITTPAIGPAKNWASVEWETDSLDSPTDLGYLRIFGIRPIGTDTLLIDNLFDKFWPLSDVPAPVFPKIRLEWQARDLAKHTPPPLNRLRVLFEAMPEGAIDPQAHALFEKGSVERGEPVQIAATFRHLDGGAMDSVLVRFSVRDAANLSVSLDRRQKMLPVGDSIVIKQSLDTRQLLGNQQFTLDVNPAGDQPEREHFNNVLINNFLVKGDKTNPLLDVTFDGQHLLNGDLISPKPEIFITLRDENRWLAMDDTSSLNITVKFPDSFERRFYLDGSDVQAQFTPASTGNLGKKNEAQVRLNPIFNLDGTYQLRVKGRDISGNQSGTVDYSINFEVINKSSISGILNYPNPFSTRTCFAYTLTGELPPVHFRLQIMNISGKIVREITESEFGPLRPGRHVSDFCWDGKDEFGDQLANGVYLYRVLAKKADGTDLEKFENKKVDGFFTNGWGKMVLIR